MTGGDADTARGDEEADLGDAAETSDATAGDGGDAADDLGDVGEEVIDGAPLTLAEFCVRAHEARCTAGASCGTEEIGCDAAYIADLCRVEVERAQAAVDAGRRRYDPIAAAACVTAIETTLCAAHPNDFAEHTHPCRVALAGILQQGEACSSYDECAAGTTCTISVDTCPGTCAPHAGVGAACGEPTGWTGVCDPNESWCDAMTWSCVALAVEGAPCDIDFQCQRHLTCDPSGECAPPGGLGDPCTWGTRPCRTGLICANDDASQDNAMTCIEGARQPGEACFDWVCANPYYSECSWDWQSPEGGVCVAATGVEGDACTGACAEGFWCDFIADSKCHARKATGEPCRGDFHIECQSNWCAAPSGMACLNDGDGTQCTCTLGPAVDAPDGGFLDPLALRYVCPASD